MDRKGPKIVTLSLCFVALTLAGTGVYAQDASSGKSKWEFELIPYLWMVNINGDVTVGDFSSHAKMSFGEIFSDLEFGGQGYLEARNDKWGLFLDATYVNLSTEEHTVGPRVGPINVDVGIKEWLLEFGGLYQFARWPLGKSASAALALDVLAGGRYWYMKGDLDVDAPLAYLSFHASKSKNWIDPFVGLGARLNLTKDLLLAIEGDVGGFGVGSEITWNGTIALMYRISRVVSVGVGYRVLNVDYESGSGLTKMKVDATMYGPMIGVGFYF